MIKHASKNNLSRSWVIAGIIAITLLLGTAPAVQAQMFSVEDESNSEFFRPSSEAYIGFEPTSVTYEGAESAEDAGLYEYDAPVLRIGYSGRTVNFFMGAGGSVTGSDDVAYFDVGGNINYQLPLYVSSQFILAVPVRISSRFTNITTEQTAITLNRFRFGSLLAGAGLKANIRTQSSIRVQLGAVPSYGFTFASGGFFGGGLGTLAVNGRLFFDQLLSNDMGLSVGYKYDFRKYNIDEERFDYRIQGHSIQVGITF